MEVGRALYPSRAGANYCNLTIAGQSPTLSGVWWFGSQGSELII